MDPEVLGACDACGSQQWELVEDLGALQTWRCASCGKEKVFHLLKDIRPPVGGTEQVFELIGQWKTRPTRQQAEEVRNAIPGLTNISLPALMRAAFEGRDLSFGRFTKSEAKALEDMLRQRELDTMLRVVIVCPAN